MLYTDMTTYHVNLFLCVLLECPRELLHLSDGGQVYLDWCGEGNPDTGPVVIVLPGITGGLGGSPGGAPPGSGRH